MRVETIDDLTVKFQALFGNIGVTLEQMSNMDDYGVMFTVSGKVKPLMERLKAQTNPALWDGEAGFGAYRNEEENFLLTLNAAPHMVLCMASVMSLHGKHLEKYRSSWA
ncbi:MAG: hypothetical protein LBF16_00995 [Pseudomonadales bacterium]|nr:hypothetical protein [Pseudomonadales bacterium]